jgi:hypothetical protein
VGGSMGLFGSFGALDPVQNFVTSVDSRPNLLFPSKTGCIVEITDDTAISKMQFRSEIKISHAAKTPPPIQMFPLRFLVASVHGQFRMEREAQTQRLLRAVANPFVTILGHMTGRQLLRRQGYDIDVERVLAACAKHGVSVEATLGDSTSLARARASAGVHVQHQSGCPLDLGD